MSGTRGARKRGSCFRAHLRGHRARVFCPKHQPLKRSTLHAGFQESRVRDSKSGCEHQAGQPTSVLTACFTLLLSTFHPSGCAKPITTQNTPKSSPKDGNSTQKGRKKLGKTVELHVKASGVYLACGEREPVLDESVQARKALTSCLKEERRPETVRFGPQPRRLASLHLAAAEQQ